MRQTRYGKLREILARGEALAWRIVEHVRALTHYCSSEARWERVAREEAAQRLAQEIVCILESSGGSASASIVVGKFCAV